MGIATVAEEQGARRWSWAHFAALMLGNVALALGPWFVRMADSGPVSAAFWRLALAVPALALLARVSGQRLGGFGTKVWLAIAGAGLFFAADVGLWHIGIGLTRMANASLFGNSGSLVIMVWGLISLHRAPRAGEWLALVAALGGAAILLGRSLEIGTATAIGDLFCVTAGLLYAGYILLIQKHRASLGGWSLLTWSSLFGLPVLLAAALLLGEPVWPTQWWPVIALALSSQLIGQGLLVYSLKHFSAMVIGLTLLTQPAVAVLVGWAVFGEVLGPLDFVGMALVAAALVLARSTQD
ncbi:MAG: DMT family transporter [Pseudomonadota bacterium]|nr:DMT family transporter [Pseudomonadota bacterium]